MTVPLVQGTLRYAWKAGQTGGVDNKPTDQTSKNAAEGSTFAAAVLPLVHACDAAAAKTVSDHMKFGAAVYDKTTGSFTSGTKPDTGAVKAALEKTYTCLGITCAHVGGLLSGDGFTAEEGMEACTIAGYSPMGGSVKEHNELDLDQTAMEGALGATPMNYALAKTLYTAGGNSASKGAFRTLQGFSTYAKNKMYDGCPGCPYKHYKQFYDYYGSHTYADDWALAALDGTTLTFAAPASVSFNFGTAHDNARKEAIKKGTAYMHVWMYAIREFEDAIDDCATCTANCNEFSANDGGPVHAWDEGVAFYTGSLEGTAQVGNSDGKMVYRLAEKRCGNFGTCTGAGGMSQVNDALFKAGGLFAQGRDLLHAGTCAGVRDVVDKIVSIMTVPLVQGTLRYAWKVGQTKNTAGVLTDNMASDQNAKNAAEGSTFAAAVLPLVHACDAASATVVKDNMKFGAAVYDKATGAFTSGTKPDTAKVKAALEKTYTCLGITCAHVGGLLNAAGMESCAIAGYNPMGGSVATHNALDLDQKAMSDALGGNPPSYDYAAAKTMYMNGGNSASKGSFRTLQGFPTGAKGKMYEGCPGCPYKHYKQFYDYYGSFTYADDWATAALDGTALTYAAPAPGSMTFDFGTANDKARSEAILKGTAYMHVWMYAIREFEDAIDDCTTCTANCNEFSTNDGGPVHAWDEGVAFYT